MTRVREASSGQDALEPVRQALRQMAGRTDIPPMQGVAPGLVINDAAGWAPATELVSGAALDDLLETAGRRWQAAPHVAAALAWKCYSYWLSLPAVVGYATVRRVPLMSPDAVLVRWSAQAPFVRVGLAAVAGPGRAGREAGRHAAARVAVLPNDPILLRGAGRGIRVVPNETALLDELRTALVDEHLTPLLTQIRTRLHLGRRALWGSLASGLAHGLSRAADLIPGSPMAAATQVLDRLALSDLVDLSERPGGSGLTVHRRTCCLAFTLPEPHRKVCAGCCIR
jgi:hypothetical protein